MNNFHLALVILLSFVVGYLVAFGIHSKKGSKGSGDSQPAVITPPPAPLPKGNDGSGEDGGEPKPVPLPHPHPAGQYVQHHMAL